MPLHTQKNICDADGQEHVYLITLHPAEEGFSLLDEIMEVFGSTVGKLSTLNSFADESIAGSVGEMLAELARGLQKKGGASLLKRVFAHTVRDKCKFTAAKIPGESEWCVNSAYRGNYGEMFEAAQFILEVNFRSFFDWFRTMVQTRMQEMLAPNVPEPGNS